LLYGVHVPATVVDLPESSLSIPAVRQLGVDRMDIVSAVRALRLNKLRIPRWLANEYLKLENSQMTVPSPIPQSRADKLVLQKFQKLYPALNMSGNSLVDGFRLDMNFPELKLNVELDGPTHK